MALLTLVLVLEVALGLTKQMVVVVLEVQVL
jgi:hypothetical protein